LVETLKIFIPMAGWGTRMRPHTWSKPKPLIAVAGRTTLDHLMDMFASLPDPAQAEYVFIIGPHLGEQIPPYVATHYPDIAAHYVVQAEMKGQSHALWLAREHMHGPMLMCFSDTMLETDFGGLAGETADGIAWVMPVPDPRRFGVAELSAQGWVTRFIEKPQTVDNNLALAGCYYFKSAERLLAAIEEQMRRGIMLKNEFFLADAITLMLEDGARIRTHQASAWLDTGTIEATLTTNRLLLERSGAPSTARTEAAGSGTPPQPNGVTIVEPVSIHPSVEIAHSVIGPYASIGAGCKLANCRIEDSILEDEVQVKDVALVRSLVGRRASVTGRGVEQVLSLNVGDDSSVVVP
jgi:glucose-1-phosphate thymidylyltransferase